ncbi:BlaI/MecI/CopY family transcriptional regulator [Clostridioides difficile]|nr:BlaI/MecI/CopY family transcriptional regulator [Clostridioides difficile]
MEVAMKEKYKWRKSTTEILLGRLVKMRILKKKRAGFQLNYEVLVTKKEYLNAIKEEKDISKYDNFFTQVFTTIHRKEEKKTEEQIKVFIESMQKKWKK